MHEIYEGMKSFTEQLGEIVEQKVSPTNLTRLQLPATPVLKRRNDKPRGVLAPIFEYNTVKKESDPPKSCKTFQI